MAEKRIIGRAIQKHDKQENWEKATGFSPMAGEVIVYDVDSNYSYPRIKLGDGSQNVNDLPFLTDVDSTALDSMLEEVLV